jgi:hypothetical protein
VGETELEDEVKILVMLDIWQCYLLVFDKVISFQKIEQY